ncbi:MAG: endonuclease III domain-containing protein [Thermodesulfovibrionales bacterium]|jgi:endonuclease-3 related protein
MDKLESIYKILYKAFGPQHWWPGGSPFEITVGAILTQNTNWSNVEKAIKNLRAAGAMNPKRLHHMPPHKLAALIRPAGYFNIKAKRLKAFVHFLMEHFDGNTTLMKNEDTDMLREKLLSIHGIGPETADSMLLYALGKPIFVIDAYTKRVLSRHNIMSHDKTYKDFQELFHAAMGRDRKRYNEYHALFVAVGKTCCRPKPRCNVCPLRPFLGNPGL